MSAKVFVDTNILIYAHDLGAGAKHDRARELIESLWESRTGVLSTQVLQELSVNLRKKVRPPLSPKATRELVADYLTWEVVINGPDSLLDALELEERYQLSYWDSLIIHAANAAGAETVYSEDLNEGQTYGQAKVVNPFLAK